MVIGAIIDRLIGFLGQVMQHIDQLDTAGQLPLHLADKRGLVVADCQGGQLVRVDGGRCRREQQRGRQIRQQALQMQDPGDRLIQRLIGRFGKALQQGMPAAEVDAPVLTLADQAEQFGLDADPAVAPGDLVSHPALQFPAIVAAEQIRPAEGRTHLQAAVLQLGKGQVGPDQQVEAEQGQIGTKEDDGDFHAGDP